MGAVSTAAQNREDESRPPAVMVGNLDQQLSKSQFGRARTSLKGGKRSQQRCVDNGVITVSVANAGRKLHKSRKSPLFQIERGCITLCALFLIETRVIQSPRFSVSTMCTLHCTSRSTMTTIFQKSTHPFYADRDLSQACSRLATNLRHHAEQLFDLRC